MFKKILIALLFIYIFFADIIIALIGISSLKSVLSALVFLLTLVYFIINYKEIILKQFLFVPFCLIVLFGLIWEELGYVNLFYTVIFGYILAQDINFSKKNLLFTVIIQFILTFYERITSSVIYTNVVSGVINENAFDYRKSFELFDVTGFRPKGLFPGTLLATSFLIYLAMLHRNNTKMLFFLLASAFVVNGRLALLIIGFTVFLNIFRKYDIIIIRKLGFVSKRLFYLLPGALLLAVFYLITPEVMWNNLVNTFDFTTDANAGRIYAYGQSVLLFISYTPIEKLFGSPGNEVFDIYGRLIASESGALSMFLDIGIVGFLYYLYYFILVFKIDKSSFFNFKSKYIGVKYVVIVTFLSFFQYEHINGNLRGTLFWFMIISIIYKSKISKHNKII